MSAALLLDGAMGTLLAARGFEQRAPLFSARALLDAPELLVELHWAYLRAGAQVLTTNSFNLHTHTLAAAGLAARQAELVARSVALLEPVRQRALGGHEGAERGAARFRIAGSIPPRPRLGVATGSADAELARAEYGHFAALLAEAGADLLLLETFTDIEEARLALEGIAARPGLELPVWLSLVAGAASTEGETRRPDGTRLASGDAFDALALLLRTGSTEIAHRVPDALLLNCTQLDAVPAALDALAAVAPASIPLGLAPHLGKRRYDGVWIERIVEGEVFAEQIHAWLQARPRYVLAGACCGSRPAEIAALARWLHPNRQTRELAYEHLAARVP